MARDRKRAQSVPLLQLNDKHDLFTKPFSAALGPLLYQDMRKKMSRYDDLSSKYANFRASSEQAERVAHDLANAVKVSLGAPAEAVFTRAVAWSSQGWRVAPAGATLSQRYVDGRFYFVICIRLASAEPQSQTFATLLSIRASGADTEVRLEDTEPKFRAYLADPSAKEDLAGEVIGVIEDTLDPDPGGEPPRLNIGFIDA